MRGMAEADCSGQRRRCSAVRWARYPSDPRSPAAHHGGHGSSLRKRSRLLPSAMILSISSSQVPKTPSAASGSFVRCTYLRKGKIRERRPEASRLRKHNRLRISRTGASAHCSSAQAYNKVSLGKSLGSQSHSRYRCFRSSSVGVPLLGSAPAPSPDGPGGGRPPPLLGPAPAPAPAPPSRAPSRLLLPAVPAPEPPSPVPAPAGASPPCAPSVREEGLPRGCGGLSSSKDASKEAQPLGKTK